MSKSKSGQVSSEQLQHFMEITGSTIDVAEFALSAAGDNLEEAINLHMSGGFPGENSFSAPPSSKAGATQGSGAKRDYIDDDGVRQADEVKRQRLLASNSSTYMRHDFSLPPQDSVFFGTGGDNLTGKAKKLNDLFRAPYDIMVDAPLQEVQRMCGEKKWLLVNIQSIDEFSCMSLNRDVWSDEVIKQVCSTTFLFWQQLYTDTNENSNPHGSRTYAQDFVEKYSVRNFPHICILDPRTGLMVWNWDEQKPKKQRMSSVPAVANMVKKERFVEKLLEFVNEHPSPAEYQPPCPVRSDCFVKRGDGSNTSSSGTSGTYGEGGTAKVVADPTTTPTGAGIKDGDDNELLGEAWGKESGSSRLEERDMKGSTPKELANNSTGKGFNAFLMFQFCGGLERVTGPESSGSLVLKLILPTPIPPQKVKFSEDSTVLEMTSLVAKILVQRDREQSSQVENTNAGGYSEVQGEAQPRPSIFFELSFGVNPVRRLSHDVHATDEAELRMKSLTSVGIFGGEAVRVTRL